MRRLALTLLLLLFTSPMSAEHRIPTNRAELKGGDWFPYVMSKIAPLQNWVFETSTSDINRKYYSSDITYQLSLKNTWDFPRFCFSLFRPKPEAFAALINAANNYTGAVTWQLHDNCISAFASQPTFYGPLPQSTNMDDLLRQMEEAAKNPPRADPEFVKKAIVDLPRFCAYLEDRLGLKDKDPQQFDPRWLTKEGLSTHPEGDEDFIEYGSWSVALASDPEKLAQPNASQLTAAQYLNFGIGEQEAGSILEELGVNWEKYRETGDMCQIASDYPRLSRLVDETDDITFSPKEAEALLSECLRAQNSVKKPQSIRGLDKLIRIARMAEKSKLGIYFAGE